MAARLNEALPELGIQLFGLQVDEDRDAQAWLAAIGLAAFGISGAGSLVWLERGRVVSRELSANALGVTGVMARSTSLWLNEPLD